MEPNFWRQPTCDLTTHSRFLRFKIISVNVYALHLFQDQVVMHCLGIMNKVTPIKQEWRWLAWPERRAWPWRCQLLNSCWCFYYLMILILLPRVVATVGATPRRCGGEQPGSVPALGCSLWRWHVFTSLFVFTVFSSFLLLQKHAPQVGDSRLPLGVFVCARRRAHVLFGVYSCLTQWLLGQTPAAWKEVQRWITGSERGCKQIWY